MKGTRRKIVIHAFEIAGASLLLLDVLLYFVMFLPLRMAVSSEQQQFASVRRRIVDDEVRVDRLKQFREAFPEAGQGLAAFKRDHIPPRRQGFSQAAKLVHRLTEQSGVELESVAYKLDKTASGPFERLGLVINVDGPFSGLLKFAHALETASDFMVVQTFNIAPGDDNQLTLRLAADLYLMP